MWPPLPPLPGAGSEAGLPSAGAERPQVGAARPGRLRAAHGADRHPGEPVSGAGPGAGTGTGGRREQGGPECQVAGPGSGAVSGDRAGAGTRSVAVG